MSAGEGRRLVLVVGVGRSGTSLLSGILGQLGFHIPQPEVSADDTNPRGFGEPRWVVDFHSRLLRERRVTVNDARPVAWEKTGAAADVAAVRAELRERATSGPFPPTLLLPLRIVRFDGGLLASLRRPEATPRNGWLYPVDWVLVRWGRPGKHEVQVGRAWQTPAPEVPGEALTIGVG